MSHNFTFFDGRWKPLGMGTRLCWSLHIATICQSWGQLNLWTKEPKAQGRNQKLKLKLFHSDAYKLVSHYLWLSGFLLTTTNVSHIMWKIVWQNLKFDFCWFWAKFWHILTKYCVRKSTFYNMGSKKYEKMHFWACIRHFLNQRKVVSRKTAIVARIVSSSELFLDARMRN